MKKIYILVSLIVILMMMQMTEEINLNLLRLNASIFISFNDFTDSWFNSTFFNRKG